MCLTGIKLSKDYFKGKDNNRFYPEYIIAAPKNACELEGYVLKIRTDYVTLYERDGRLILHTIYRRITRRKTRRPVWI